MCGTDFWWYNTVDMSALPTGLLNIQSISIDVVGQCET